MARLASSLIMVLMLTGAVSARPTQQEPVYDRGEQPAPYAAWVDCQERGGEMRREGFFQRYMCVTRFADAGKVCDAKSDCEGQCFGRFGRTHRIGQAATGICQVDTADGYGCRARIDGGRVVSQLCID